MSRLSAGYLLLLAVGRLAAQERHEFTELHMGLAVRIVLYAPDGREGGAREAARAAFDRIATLEAILSDYREESELRRLERRPAEWVVVSPPLFSVLQRALEVARASDGAFDPTVAPLVALWREARRAERLPDSAALSAARSRVGWERISLDSSRRAVRLDRPDTRLDLGAIAKGYILGEALGRLRDLGVTRALIEAGGDIVVGAAPPGQAGWRIEAPDAGEPLASRALALTHAALATSGPTAQFVEIEGERYSHVVDPRTGLGLRNGLVATVIGPDPALADALATALTVMGPEKGAGLLARFPGVTASLRPVTGAR